MLSHFVSNSKLFRHQLVAPRPRQTVRRSRNAICQNHRAMRVVCFTDDDTHVDTKVATVPVRFELPLQVNWGETLRVVGSSSALGEWDLEKAPEMCWNDGHVWALTVELPAESTVWFKFVKMVPGEVPIWEYGMPDRELKVTAGSDIVTACTWDSQFFDINAATAATEEDLAPSDFLSPPSYDADKAASATTASTAAAAAAAAAVVEKTPITATIVEEIVDAVEEIVIDEPIAAAVVEEEEDNKVEDDDDDDTTTPPTATVATPTTKDAAGKKKKSTNSKKATPKLNSAAKTAGAVALGVAGAAVLSAFAIDITEVAVSGAVIAAAGSAALSNSRKKGSSVKTNALTGEVEAIIEEDEAPVSQEPGVIIAAGLMSAFDSGKAIIEAASTLGEAVPPVSEKEA